MKIKHTLFKSSLKVRLSSFSQRKSQPQEHAYPSSLSTNIIMKLRLELLLPFQIRKH